MTQMPQDDNKDQKDPKKSNEPVDFEVCLKELESVVQKLEKGEIPLETQIEMFERGMKLSKLCQKKIDEVEARIDIVVGSSNESSNSTEETLETKPFIK